MDCKEKIGDCQCCELEEHRQCRCVDKHGCPYLEVGVALTRCELEYDIKFVTNRIAKLTARDEKGNQTKIAADITAEGKENADYIDRLIISAVKKLKSSTSWASGERGGRVVTDKIPPCIKDWTFVFHLPRGWRGEADTLCSLCHDYVKNRVISEWLKMVVPNMSATYEAEADENMRDLKFELRKEVSADPPVLYSLTGM